MSADCSLQVVESQHRSGDLILANDKLTVVIHGGPFSRARSRRRYHTVAANMFSCGKTVRGNSRRVLLGSLFALALVAVMVITPERITCWLMQGWRHLYTAITGRR
jgi:hypothetical protein